MCNKEVASGDGIEGVMMDCVYIIIINNNSN